MSDERRIRAGTCRGTGASVTVADDALLGLLGLPLVADADEPGVATDRLTRWLGPLVDPDAIAEAHRTAAVVAPYRRDLHLPDDSVADVLVTVAPGAAPDGWSASVVVIDADDDLRVRFAAQESIVRIAERIARIAGWSVELPDREVRFSPEMTTVLGLDVPARLHLDLALGFYPEQHRATLSDCIDRCLTVGEPFDVEAELSLGHEGVVPLRVVGEPRRDEHGRIVGLDGGVSDLTSLRRIEQQVRRQAEALDAANFAISIQEPDGTLVYWNAAAERMYGWSREEAIGRHITELVGELDHEVFDELSRRLEETGQWTGRIENTDRWGRRFPVGLQVTLVRDDQGVPISRLSVVADISDRVELEERLAMAQKLDSLGQLTGGIAHDFNNLLTVIVGGAELLTADLEADQRHGPIAKMLLTAAERGAELTNRLLVFARRQSLQPAVVEPMVVIDEMYPLLRRSLPESVELAVRHAPDLWEVLVDPGQLEAALMNIAANARDAMDQGGTLRIETSNVMLSPGDVADYVGARPGDYVRITLTDDGIGMSPEVAEHAFEPFFTTKDIGRGNGLGLSMVYGFVQQSGGFVDLESELGVGTRIELFLPRGDISQGPLTASEDTGVVQRGSETVLVVEDEELVRRHAVRVLDELGYHVVEAANGREALARLREHDEIGALFTDVVMPGGMSGFELAAAARVLRPELPVLYTSGYADADPGDDPSVAGEVLRKPYRREVLADRIRRVIDGAD